MTIIGIIDTFTFYGIDVILLAAITAAAVQICKATFLKRIKRKLLTFLPFIFGTAFYAAYAAAKNLSVYYLLAEYVSVLEHGISVGAVATLLYVLYEQFVREKKPSTASEGVISTLIEGYVPANRVEEVTKLIADAIEKDVTGNGAKRAAEILAENAESEITESDIGLLSRLIIETLAKINTK
ncbi:MAG: hypothetical protein K2L42_03560 [Clostridia bacterium]|nr:hypothetical protein [Clostridia bacterium]